jgi:hypothetical protein
VPPENLIACGQEAGGVAAEGAVKLAIYGRNPNVHFRLQEIRRDLCTEIPAVLRDLLDLAAYVYTADQAVRRAGGGRVDGDEIGEGWRRTFRFQVPVRELDLWRSDPVLGELKSTLSFLSEDTYEFEFIPIKYDAALDGFIDFTATPYDGRVEEVVMFSGGLDSLAGAVTESVVGKRRVLLVNHRSNEKLTPRHGELLRGLAGHAGDFYPLHFPVRLNKTKAHGLEHTQRTRSFLFAAFGALFAHMIGLPRLRFYENGVVSLNLPLSAQVVGARASRTTHPGVLAGLARLLSTLLGRRFDVENPFLWDTKTDVVKRIAAAGCGELIGLSTSCGHTWERTVRHTHCGVCSQCIDRRFAVLAACQEANDPGDAYAVDLLTGPRRPGEPKTMLAAYLELANRVERMGEADFRTQFGELVRALPYLNLPPSVGAARVYALYRDHARQVTGVIDRAIAANAVAIRRQELPRNCLLRLAVDEAPGDAPADATPAVTPARPEGNYFVRLKRFWAIRYGSGPENIYPDDRGFGLLRILLTNPDVPFSASGLFARAFPPPLDATRTATVSESLEGGVGVSNAGGDDALDPEAVDALHARLDEIRELRATWAGKTSTEAVDHLDELETEERRISERLRRDRKLGGQPRKLGDLAEKVRKRVGNAIKRALDLIRDDDRPLAEHLSKPVLTTGNTIVYRPATGTSWSVVD